MCTRVMSSSLMMESSFVKKDRMSAFVAVQGRLPIQIAWSLRAAGVLGVDFEDSAGAVVDVSPYSAVVVVGVDFDLLALRRAFLERGSGRERSIASSSSVGSRLHFWAGGEAVVEAIMRDWFVEMYVAVAFMLSKKLVGELVEEFRVSLSSPLWR